MSEGSSVPVVTRWLWPGKTFLEVDSMVLSWWIVACLATVFCNEFMSLFVMHKGVSLCQASQGAPVPYLLAASVGTRIRIELKACIRVLTIRPQICVMLCQGLRILTTIDTSELLLSLKQLTSCPSLGNSLPVNWASNMIVKFWAH